MEKSPNQLIVDILQEKSGIKQKIYDNTLKKFNQLKEVMNNLTLEMNKYLKGLDKRIVLEYQDRGKFESQVKIAGDVLIFSMHSNVFQFNREHSIWKNPYVTSDKLASYCGIINIYNFLSDSFKYQRIDDLGYLIARIFINKDDYFFVEGKRQLGFLYNNFGAAKINNDTLKSIIQSAILYSLDFDLLVPPYDAVKIVSVAQMNKKIETSRIQTGKRLGFLFNSDDVHEAANT